MRGRQRTYPRDLLLSTQAPEFGNLFGIQRGASWLRRRPPRPCRAQQGPGPWLLLAPVEPGNQAGLRHGGFSPRKVGEHAELVREELLASSPGLADDPESASPVALYCRAVAREELAHEGLERAAANGAVISARLLEAASSAARVARELGDGLGIGPRASAELRQIQTETALSLATLAQQAPAVLAAIHRALAACGLAERGEEVIAALGVALVEVEEGNAD